MFGFTDKVCVVTGGGSGIGLAVATLFANDGARVVLADIADAAEAAASLDATYIRTDVSDERDVAALMAQTAALHGRIDVVVNNAGIIREAALGDTTIEDFDTSIAVNAHGVLFGLKHAARFMQPGGAIVNTASLAAQVGFPGYASYAASKAAIVSLTRVAAIELGRSGIRVNCICPSSVDTPMLAAQENGDVEQAITTLASPLGMSISGADIASVIAFLASDAAAAVSGQAIAVDAGATAGYSEQLIEGLVAHLRADA
ncbi:SDR family NAD(P)-dependent oxidoreductase [Gordonia sp. NPDC003376]